MSMAGTIPARRPRTATGWSALQALLLRFSSVLVVLAILLVWQAAAMALAVPVYILPQPVALVMALPTTARTLFSGWGTTVLEAAAGFVIGNAVSIAVAFLVTVSRPARAGIMPVALAIKSVPMVAITPLITLSVGFGHATVVAVAAIVCFFPTLVNVSRGLRAAPRGAVEVFHLLDANPVQVFWKLRLPYALPYLFTALRITAPAAIGGAMLAEYVASNSGLGYLIQDGYQRFQFLLVWQIVVLATVTTLAAFTAVTSLEQRMLERRH
jgi:NitT/TauT family transport system permease protein